MTAEEGNGAGRGARRFRLALGGSTLAMLGLSWPLWAGGGAFPAVPFVRGLTAAPAALSWGLVAVMGSGGALAIAGRPQRARAPAAVLDAVAACLISLLVLQDQDRLQPWVYQFGLMSLALATLPPARALGLCRLFLIALYFHSGLSKLDVSFCRELGLTFLATALDPFGLSPQRWPPGWADGAVLAMPVGEIAVALGLVHPRTRRLGLAGAVALHTGLMAILGPWGLRHSPIVLVWNAALIVEGLILFGPRPAPSTDSPWSVPGALTAILFLIAAILPFGERQGLWDTWPSFALYASHAERTDVFLHEDEASAYPPPIRAHVSGRASGPWRRLDLTAWSRAARGVPVYPQGRTANGIAEALASWKGRPRLVWVRQWGRADRWTGRRHVAELFGYDAIRRWGDGCRLNAHPAPVDRRP